MKRLSAHLNPLSDLPPFPDVASIGQASQGGDHVRQVEHDVPESTDGPHARQSVPGTGELELLGLDAHLMEEPSHAGYHGAGVDQHPGER